MLRFRRARNSSAAAPRLRAAAVTAGFAGTAPARQSARLLAQPEQLVAVAEDIEPEPARGRILQRLDLVVLELDDEAAAVADQMVVVRPPFGDLVQRLTGAEVARRRDAGLLQQLDGPVDRR